MLVIILGVQWMHCICLGQRSCVDINRDILNNHYCFVGRFMSYLKKVLLFLSLLIVFSETSFAKEPTFALKVDSWQGDYQISIQMPPVLFDGSEIKVVMTAPGGPFFTASVHFTYGYCTSVKSMSVQDVLSVPKKFESDGVEFEYVRAEGDLYQIVNMFDGSVGLATATPTIYSCSYYENLWREGKSYPNWYGSGQTVIAVYKVKRVPAAGVHNISIPVNAYFTRRETGSSWINMGSLSGYANQRTISGSYTVTAWCKVINNDIKLDHKLMTPDLVEGNVVSTGVRLECGGGGKGIAKLSLSNKSNKSTVNLGNNVLSEVSLSATEVNVAKDSSVNIAVSSKLTTGSKEIIAGELNGTEVLTVEWL